MGDVFYREGLHFECQRCSACCRYEPGFVFLSYNDLDRLQQATGLSRTEFVQRYCRGVYINGAYRLSLIEKDNYDCIFWTESGCSVYEHRPLQCRSYPFWPDILHSRESWNSLYTSCKGVNQGKLHSFEEIQKWLKKREEEPIVLLTPGELRQLQGEHV